MAVPVDKWQFSQLVLSSHGPESQSLRLVLLSIAAEISNSQSEAWPSQRRISERAQLSERQIKRLVKRGEELGWLARRWARKPGAAWRYTIYTLAVPNNLLSEVPEHPWDVDRSWRRGAKAATRSAEQGDKLSAPCGPEEDASNVTNDASNVTNDASNVPSEGGSMVPFTHSKGTRTWPTTLPSDDSSQVSTHVPTHGARRTSRARASEQISENDSEIQRKRREAARIVAELTARASQ